MWIFIEFEYNGDFKSHLRVWRNGCANVGVCVTLLLSVLDFDSMVIYIYILINIPLHCIRYYRESWRKKRAREIEMAYHIISYDAAVHQPEISLPLKNLLSHSLQVTNQNPTPTSRAFSSFRTISQTEQSWGATQWERERERAPGSAMASQSPCKWSRATKSYATTKLSSSLCNPSVFFSFHTSPSKRSRITASSLHDSSSSSSCTPPLPPVAAKAKQRTRKSVTSDNSTSEPNALLVKSDTRSLRIPALSFKSLFGRRALWRRIFFASKKVRSIILLNVITIVYGKLGFQLLCLCFVAEKISLSIRNEYLKCFKLFIFRYCYVWLYGEWEYFPTFSQKLYEEYLFILRILIIIIFYPGNLIVQILST